MPDTTSDFSGKAVPMTTPMTLVDPPAGVTLPTGVTKVPYWTTKWPGFFASFPDFSKNQRRMMLTQAFYNHASMFKPGVSMVEVVKLYTPPKRASSKAQQIGQAGRGTGRVTGRGGYIKRIKDLTNHQKKLEKRISEQQKIIDNQQDTIDAKIKLAEDFKTQLEAEKVVSAENIRTVSDMGQIQQDLRAELKRAREDLQQAGVEAGELVQREEELRAVIIASGNREKELQAELAQAGEREKDLQEQLAQAGVESVSLDAQVQDLKQRLLDAKRGAGYLQDRNNALAGTTDKLRDKLKGGTIDFEKNIELSHMYAKWLEQTDNKLAADVFLVDFAHMSGRNWEDLSELSPEQQEEMLTPEFQAWRDSAGGAKRMHAPELYAAYAGARLLKDGYVAPGAKMAPLSDDGAAHTETAFHPEHGAREAPFVWVATI